MYIEAVEILETFGEAAGRPIGIGNPSEKMKNKKSYFVQKHPQRVSRHFAGSLVIRNESETYF